MGGLGYCRYRCPSCAWQGERYRNAQLCPSCGEYGIERLTPTARPKQQAGSASARVGVAVRERRRELGLTARQLAAASGLSASLVSDLENGKRGLGVESLVALAVALGTAAGKLLGEG